MLAEQSAVMLVILEPVTPGGLRLSMDCRLASSSATADDMVSDATRNWPQRPERRYSQYGVQKFSPNSLAIRGILKGIAEDDSSDGHYN